MSVTVDRERASIRVEEENARLEKLLLELLVVVRSRARSQTGAQIAELTQKSPRTVLRRYQLLSDLLDQMKRKGIRKPQW